MKRGIIALLGIFYFVATSAQDKIETDRPDQTETPFLVPKKFFQAEIGFNREKLNTNEVLYVHPTALLKYGLNKKIEFRLETNVVSDHVHLIPSTKKIRGLQPVEIGAKVFLLEEKGLRPKTSVIGHVGLPFLSSKNYRPRHLVPSFRFTMQNTITQSMAIGYNVGAAWDGESSNPAWLYTFAPGFNLSERWYAYVEAFGFIAKNEAPEHSLDVGIAYFINNDMKLDFSGGFGLSSRAVDHYVAVGFSFRLPAF